MDDRVVRYLSRIGIKEVQPPSFDFLSKLQEAHFLHIPFENISIHEKERQSDIGLSLTIDDLFDKIVAQRRGGFCYELNGLFGWLLSELGFSVEYLVAIVVIRGIYEPDHGMLDHMVLRINDFDEPYLVDVGFGDSYRTPLSYTRQNQDISGTYRIQKRVEALTDPLSQISYIYEMQRIEDGKWVPQYILADDTFQLKDFVLSCNHTETSDESSFTKRLVVTKATKEGRITLSNDSLTITKNGKLEKTGVQSPDWSRLIKQYFHIETSIGK